MPSSGKEGSWKHCSVSSSTLFTWCDTGKLLSLPKSRGSWQVNTLRWFRTLRHCSSAYEDTCKSSLMSLFLNLKTIGVFGWVSYPWHRADSHKERPSLHQVNAHSTKVPLNVPGTVASWTQFVPELWGKWPCLCSCKKDDAAVFFTRCRVHRPKPNFARCFCLQTELSTARNVWYCNIP